MKPRKITENVYWLGALDWNRRLFDALIPLPDGTSYNAKTLFSCDFLGSPLANALRPQTRFVSLVGSYGWATKAAETLTGMLANLKVEILNPVICKGLPREKDFAALDELARTSAAKHRENNFT